MIKNFTSVTSHALYSPPRATNCHTFFQYVPLLEIPLPSSVTYFMDGFCVFCVLMRMCVCVLFCVFVCLCLFVCALASVCNIYMHWLTLELIGRCLFWHCLISVRLSTLWTIVLFFLGASLSRLAFRATSLIGPFSYMIFLSTKKERKGIFLR